MPPAEIHNFTTNLIAFWRPKKRKYHALTWNNIARHWDPWYGAIQGGLSKHTSTNHPGGGRVQIKIATGGAVSVQASGEYLMLGATRMTIVKRSSGAIIPNYWKNHEFGDLIVREPVATAAELWGLPPAAPAAPAPVLAITTAEVLPKRIAWIIAEDAAKNDEKCPITMEPISPITASVTNCFHTFESDAIATWLANHTTCPQCRKPCVATVAFTDL